MTQSKVTIKLDRVANVHYSVSILTSIKKSGFDLALNATDNYIVVDFKNRTAHTISTPNENHFISSN